MRLTNITTEGEFDLEEILKFLNAEIFSYMLHGAELFLAVLLFGIGVTRRKFFALRITLSGLCFIGLSLAFGVLLEEIFPYGRYLMTFLLAFAVYPLAYKVGLWENLFRVVAAAATQNTAFCAAAIFCGACGWDAATVIFPNAIAQIAVYLAVQVGVYCLCHIQMRNMNIGFAQERYPLIIVAIVLSLVNYIIQIGRQSLYTKDFFVWQIMFISCDVLLLCMLFSFSERSRLRKENIFLDRLRVSEEKQYELDKNSMEVINIKCR